jgi:hypothetical protein
VEECGVHTPSGTWMGEEGAPHEEGPITHLI